MPKLVLIAGGGIGGLATAIALAQRGIHSHVLERRATFTDDGAGIQIGPNGTHVLKRLGIDRLLAPVTAKPKSIRVIDGLTGKTLTQLPLGDWIENRHHSPYWTAHRSDLHDALMRVVGDNPSITLTVAASIEAVTEDGSTVAAIASDGRRWTGDGLICADGLWSRLRGAVDPLCTLEPAGKSALRTVIAAEALPQFVPRGETCVWMMPGAHVVHYPIRQGRELAIAVIVSGGPDNYCEDWSGAVAGECWNEHPTLLRSNVSQILQAARNWRRWSLQTMPVAKRWSAGRVALLGDAAHPVLPFLAQGGVLALEDAVVVADCLARSQDDFPAGFAMYERVRRTRAQQVALASRRNGEVYHMNGARASARNLALRITPPALMMRRYDWLYGWKPQQ